MEQPWGSVKTLFCYWRSQWSAALPTDRAGGDGEGWGSHSLDALAVWILWPGLPFLLDSLLSQTPQTRHLSVALGPEREKP